MSIDQKLTELDIILPTAPKPAGSYVPCVRAGNMLFTAGAICMVDGKMTHTGPVGQKYSIEEGYEAAEICARNILAVLKDALGSLDRVEQFVTVSGFVYAVPGFWQSPSVINGASDFFVKVFGDAGRHARTAVSVSGLPLESTVEVQVVVQVKN